MKMKDLKKNVSDSLKGEENMIIEKKISNNHFFTRTSAQPPIFVKAQSILESNDGYSIEEIIVVGEELLNYSKQVMDMGNIMYKLAFDKLLKQTKNRMRAP